MPADRSTLPRGTVPGRPGWPEPTPAASRRLPAAARERKPALAALALLLIIGGAFGAGYLVMRSGQRSAAIEIVQPVGPGQRIPLAAMRKVEITSGGLPYVPWAEASQVSRYYAATAIPPGTLLSGAMVARTGDLTAGRFVLGLSLKDSQLPAGLAVGDRVNVYQTSDATEDCPGSPGGMLAAGAVVVSVSTAPPASGAGTDVEVAVAPARAGAVACNAANGLAGLAMLPAGRG